jgi:hypothetical protein
MRSLQTSVGTLYNCLNAEGVDKTGYFASAVTGYKGTFNVGDGGARITNAPELFWLAEVFDDSALFMHRLDLMDKNGFIGGARDFLYYNDSLYDGDSALETPSDHYVGNIEMASFYSSRDDANGLFAALHGGLNNINHGHLDSGTFILDALGERFAIDLGNDSYSLPSYFNITSGRWNYYRTRAEGHNTVVINPDVKADQMPNAFTRIVEFESKPRGGYAIVDLTPAFTRYVTDVKRGLMLGTDRQYVMVQDEIAGENPFESYWFMHTRAQIELSADGRSAILTQNGKRLWAGILSPGGAFDVMPAAPLPSSPETKGTLRQNKNEGIQKLAIHAEGVTELSTTVVFFPLKEHEQAPKKLPRVAPLKNWRIPDGEIKLAAPKRILVDGIPIGKVSANQFTYLVKLPYDAEKPPVISVESDYEAEVIQAEGVPGAAKILIKDPENGGGVNEYQVEMRLLPLIGEAPSAYERHKVAGAEASATPQEEHGPGNSLDDDFVTRWAAQGKQWIQYDLGAEKKVNYVAVAWFTGDARSYVFNIELSADGENWTRVFDGESSAATNECEVLPTPETMARYVRLNVQGNNENNWSNVSEVRIYGKK